MKNEINLESLIDLVIEGEDPEEILHQALVGQECTSQRFELRIPDPHHNFLDVLEHLARIIFRSGQEVFNGHLLRIDRGHIVDDDLQVVLVKLASAPHMDEAGFRQRLIDCLGGLPHSPV